MSRYTDYSARVYACLDEAARLGEVPVAEPSSDMIESFIAKWERLRHQMLLLSADEILCDFACQYSGPPKRFDGRFCYSYHQYALQDAGFYLLAVLGGAISWSSFNAQVSEPGTLADLSSDFIDRESLAHEWNNAETRQAIRNANLGYLFGEMHGWLKDECIRTERAMATQPFKTRVSSVPLTPEEKTILEKLWAEHPMTVVQADFNVGAANTAVKYARSLKKKKLIHRPGGPRSKKGWGLTEKGVALMQAKTP